MAIEKKTIKTKIYLVLKDIDPNTKCPPQSRLIIETISKAGGKLRREELLTLLKRPVEEGGLKTNQTAERILGFYKPKLVAMGVLREDEESTEVDFEVPDKPAKEEKAAGDAATPAEASAGKGKSKKGEKGEHKAA